MKQQKDDMPTWLALPLVGAIAAYWYAQQSPENYQQVMAWVAAFAGFVKWATETQVVPQGNVAAAGASNLRSLAVIVFAGAIIIGLIYVVIELSRRNNAGKGPIDATVRPIAGQTKQQPAFKSDRSIIGRGGARRVE